MIFDMSSAPDTVYRTYWSSEFFSSAHTITLDTVSGRIYLNGSNVNTMVVLDWMKRHDLEDSIPREAIDNAGGRGDRGGRGRGRGRGH